MVNFTFIFDLDDTLYCEHDYVRSGFKEVAIYLNSLNPSIQIDGVFERLVAVWKIDGRGQVFNIVCEELGIQVNIRDLVQVYREHKPTLSLYDDAVEVLSYFYEKKIPIGLITDGKSEMQWNKIKALNIERFFQALIVTDDLGGSKCWKPSVLPFLRAAEVLGLDVNQCVYVGDNPHKDFVTAKKLGMKTVRVIRNIGDHMNTFLDEDYEANFQITSLTEIFKLKL